jgi:hypothetical protein
MFQVITAASAKMTAFWDKASCSLGLIALMMEAVGTLKRRYTLPELHRSFPRTLSSSHNNVFAASSFVDMNIILSGCYHTC